MRGFVLALGFNLAQYLKNQGRLNLGSRHAAKVRINPLGQAVAGNLYGAVVQLAFLELEPILRHCLESVAGC